MKVSVQLGLLPGKSVSEKQKWAAEHGVDGIEISAWDYPIPQLNQARRDFEDSLVPLSSICGNPTFNFLDPDPAKRKESIDQCKEYLKLAGDLGAVGQIVPPIFGPARINDLSPYKSAIQLEKELLVSIIQTELAQAAEVANTYLLLEPLNRYEQHLLRKQMDAVEIIKAAGSDWVKVIADVFHMHIEETNMAETIRQAGHYIKHIHLADNTRLEPGTGDINFVQVFQALLEIGFTGYMAYECGLSGSDSGLALAKSLEYVHQCMAKARAKNE